MIGSPRLGIVLLVLLVLLALLPLPGAARAQALVADLSDHLIEVTTGFRGAKLLLFGAVEGEGDVVVVVRGPNRPAVVRRKARIAGVWVNAEQATFEAAPSFYRIAANRPLQAIAGPSVLARYRLGPGYLDLKPQGTETPAEAVAFRGALIRNMAREGLYPFDLGQVLFLGNRLFRTDVFFPSNVPTGLYTVTVYLFRDGGLVSAQSTPLAVNKAGLGARLFNFAHRQPALYGLAAILMALVAGWSASWVAGALYRKV